MDQDPFDIPSVWRHWNEFFDWMGDVLAHQKATEKWQKDMLETQRKGFESVVAALGRVEKALNDLNRTRV